MSTTPDTTVPCWIGNNVSAGNPWIGGIQEVRISNVARSTNWEWAIYQNMASNSVFNLYGPVTSSSSINTTLMLLLRRHH